MQQITTRLPSAPATEMVDAIRRYEGSTAGYLAALLAWQCRMGGAKAGAIVRLSAADQVDVLASEPAHIVGTPVPPWLAHGAQLVPRCAELGKTVVAGLPGMDDSGAEAGLLIVVPLRGAKTAGAAVFVVDAGDPSAQAAARERLELGTTVLELYEQREGGFQREVDLDRLRRAMETVAAVDRHERFKASAMAFVNEIAARWDAERVSVGLTRGRYVRVEALSNTEKLARTMALVQDIESAMEECADQDTELVYPAGANSDSIVRETAELSQRHGPVSVCSLPLRKDAEVVGVLTVERDAEAPLSVSDIEGLRLVCELCTARLLEKRDADLWPGARMAQQARRGLKSLLGPRHTLAKAAAVLALLGAIFVTTVRAPDRVAAGFVVRAVGRQAVPVPFDGYLTSVRVRPGDAVTAGESILATLDTSELRLSLSAAQAERESHVKEADAARTAGKISDAQIAEASADEAQARIDLLSYQIDRAEIRSPITGVVLTGDIERMVGAPLRTGDVLFEVAPAGSLAVRIAVPEDRIVDVEKGQKGTLASAAFPGERIGFVIDRVERVASLEKQRNVFHADATLDRVPEWMRPGMEGEARVKVGRASYAALWSRGLVNWLRMRLWL